MSTPSRTRIETLEILEQQVDGLERLATAVRRLADRLTPERIYLLAPAAEAHSGADLMLLVVLDDQVALCHRSARFAERLLIGNGIFADLHVISFTDFRSALMIHGSLPAEAVECGELLYAAPWKHDHSRPFGTANRQ